MNEKNNVHETVIDNEPVAISFKAELARKAIHFLSLIIPVGYGFIDKTTALLVIIPIAIIFTFGDILSKKIKFLGNLVSLVFGKLLRKHEKPDSPYLNGASWVAISSVMVIAAFPKFIAIVSLTILIISDIFAAIIGRAYGKHKIYNKSVEGSSAFFITSLAIVFGYYFIIHPPITFLIGGFLASIFATIAELMSQELDIDDNISIPFSAGMTFWIISSIADNYGLSFAYLLK